MSILKRASLSSAVGLALTAFAMQAHAIPTTGQNFDYINDPQVAPLDANGDVTVPSPIVATPGVDSAGNPASPLTYGTDVHVSHNGIGEALVFPYYTARDGKRSLFNITNTSGETIAVKVIVRVGRDSKHALDFTVVLSPYDVWAGYIRGASAAEAARLTQRIQDGKMTTWKASDVIEEGHPVFVRDLADNTCVVAAFDDDRTGDQLDESVEPLNVNFGSSLEDLQEGYVTMIASGAARRNAQGAIVAAARPLVASANTHTPAACTSIAANYFLPNDADNNYWTPESAAGALNNVAGVNADGLGPNLGLRGAPGAGNGDDTLDRTFDVAGNVLKGNFSLIDPLGGLGAGTQAIAIANFNQSGDDLVTLQSVPYLYEPTLASSNGLWTSTGLRDVEIALSSDRLINEWSNNPVTSAETPWVVTFPTKVFYTNGTLNGTTIFNERNKWRSDLPNWKPYTINTAEITDGILVNLYPYDREENRLTNILVPSPAPYDRAVLPYEVNVITFQDYDAVNDVLAEDVLGSQLRTNFDLVDEFNDTASNGWLTMMFPNVGGVLAARGEAYTEADSIPMPAVGFMFKSRKKQNSPAESYNQIIDHSHVTDDAM